MDYASGLRSAQRLKSLDDRALVGAQKPIFGDSMSVLDQLAQLPYFSGLTGEALAGLSRVVRQREVQAGEQILIAGEPCEGLYFVVDGQVRLIKISSEGGEHVMAVLGPGATFNDIAVFDGGANSDSAVAVGRTIIGIIPRGAMTRLIDGHPAVAKAALKLLSSRQRTLGLLVEDLALRDVTARTARLLLGCVGSHEHILEHAQNACRRITHQELATMVGSVREVVQRALKQLERDGAIAVERSHIEVLDATKLEKWARINAR
jgi:CRP/FNR family transcriptional regulator